MNNSQFIAKYLINKGFDTAFGVTGGGAMFLNEAFRSEKKMKFVFTHHEQSATMAADAYYRIKKKPAIATVLLDRGYKFHYGSNWCMGRLNSNDNNIWTSRD